MQLGAGMETYQRLLAKAKAEGTVNIERGSLGWKNASKATLKQIGLGPAKKTKSKSKLRDLDSKRGPRAELEASKVDIKDELWDACVAFEKGEVDISALLQFDVPLDQIQEWFIQEGIARNLEEIRQRNGG